MEVAYQFIGKAIDFVLDASVRQVAYIIYYKRNVEELQQSAEVLGNNRTNVVGKIEEARKRLEDICSNPENWCHDVEVKIKDIEDFECNEAHAKTGCSRGILPFLWYRHKLGRKAKKMAMDVASLSNDPRRNEDVSRKQNPKSSDTALSNTGYFPFASREGTKEDIMKQLKDPTVRMIGVYGPGGVGKTTFVRAIAEEARSNSLFDLVVMVKITSEPNLQKIQEEIAYPLQLTSEGEGENWKADRLRKRLKQKTENILLILDDLWDELDLKMLGISFDEDDSVIDRKDLGSKMGGKEERPSNNYDGEKELNFEKGKNRHSAGAYKGCKILLTSREKKVLSDKMNVKEDSIFILEVLKEEEAVTFFKKEAGILDEKSQFNNPEIVKKCCGGLPMAILTVGKALRNKSESVLDAELEKLKSDLIGVHSFMEISVKMSYDHLENEELKSIFLLCAQMGHQPLIVDLVKYCFGLGMLKGVHTLKDARDRVLKSIEKLEDSSLLLGGNSSSDQFNMHDLVRDAALSIAQKNQNVFILRNDKLDVWPSKKELKRCTVISIYKSDIVDDLPKVINCPQLTIFHIDNDDPNLKIPDRFFAQMEELRVLILIGINLPSLPSSIKCLSNLRMLYLERCTLGNLSIIGDLKKLRILSLSRSKIEDWPTRLGGLSKLHLLDISDCSIGKSIPPYFISSLTSLEEVYIRNSLIKMAVEGVTKQSEILVLSELKYLHELKIVDVCIPGADTFPADLFFDKLDYYKVVIGDFKTLSIGDFKMTNNYEASRSLALQLNVGIDIHSLKGVKMLFKRVENLLLGELNEVQNVVCELSLDGFPDLKILSIVNNVGIEYIVNNMQLSNTLSAFPKLESLSIFSMVKIKNICCGPVTAGSFSSLKTIKVKMCANLKNLFSFFLVKFLVSLETVDASECNQLAEIVDQVEVSDKVEFHKLCSLTLQDLPSFTSFYTNNGQATRAHHAENVFAETEQSVTTFLPLFCEKVEISKLESLHLSSIKIHKIWSDQLPTCSFQNLIKLTVKDCRNLTYLCSLSVATNLKKLKGLFVSQCHKMETLFSIEGDSNVYSEEIIFPELEEIQLIKMKVLKEIWPAKVSAESFSGLISVHIEKCKKLDKIFPSHMQGCYRSLDSLKVLYCHSVEVIFEIKYPLQQDAKLKIILFESLSNLKHVWSRDSKGVVNFTNLRSINVSSCDKLSYVLPLSVAKGLSKLEDLTVKYCNEMEEIVGWDAGLETDNEPLVFPEVTSIHFYWLQNMRYFYKGRLIIDFPKLKLLEVKWCGQLEAFTTENTDEVGRTIFSAEKVISNLEHLEIDLEEAKWLKSNIGKYCMHRLKQLRLWYVPSAEVLYQFLRTIPNLERLELYSLNYSFRELVPSGNTAPQQRLGTVLQLKELTLYDAYRLEDIGFERDPVLQRLERLVLYDCRKLIKLAHHTVSFAQMTYLEVKKCSKLKILMSSSTAKSLVRLATMKVIDCDGLEEIVTDDEGNEDERVVDIVFGKLITIELGGLTNLTSFCSDKNCEFSFPLLEKLILRDCLKMKTFTKSHPRTPKLQTVLLVEGGEEEEGKWYWEGDLNATIDKVSFKYKSSVCLSDYPKLEQVWCDKNLVQEGNFGSLKTLVVKNIGYLEHVIPSHLLLCFKNLEELEVGSCDAVQVIFNINDNTVMTKGMGMFRLKKLSLTKLPRLQHVWDRDPEGIIGLHDLQHLSVQECSSLKYLLSASVAKDLGWLRKLSVQDCDQLVEIFVENETSLIGDTKPFEFCSLTSLNLGRLPKLKYFYHGHNLKFPMLKELHLDPSVILNCQVTKPEEAYPKEHLLIPFDKDNLVIHGLEKLSFHMGDGKVIWDLRSLKLELESFSEQPNNVLYRFLQTIPIPKKLVVKYRNLKEMFFAKRPSVDYAGALSHLEELRLYSLHYLRSIGLEHSWTQAIPKHLQKLDVQYCGQLKNLVPPAGMVSFSNLTDLDVYCCRNMLYLFTSSTAQSLAQLKRMSINRCSAMQEIVCKEGDESHGEIIFGQLQTLYLDELPKLKCFYSGNYTLCFPSLEEASIVECLSMKTFCPLIKINEETERLLSGVGLIKHTPWEGDVNTTICKMNEKKIAKSARELEALYLGYHSHFEEMWRGAVPIPHACFTNLKSFIVDGCDFLSIVLPSHLLPFLNNMQKLEVRNCSSVKTIFDAKCLTNDNKMAMPTLLPLPFSLKELVLDKLPNLESVWNEDHDGVIKVQLLQLVHADTGIEAAHEGTNEEFMFPSLTSLTLLDLPNFKCFYCSVRCVQLKRLGQDSHIKDQACLKEITPNLDKLSLAEKELKMIWHGQCHTSHSHKVKVLNLQGFNVDSDEFPYLSLQEVPNIEELVVKNSSFKEIFCSQRPHVDSTGFLSLLKRLELTSLSELISIGVEHSWVQESFLKNLETLKATSCSRLRNLVSSSVCFSGLTVLSISQCNDMVHLFPSSTAKSLVQLKKMSISFCKSIQEIVSKEGCESHDDDEIVFGQLQKLNLKYLPNLESFYKGTLSFPSLEKLSVIYCDKMDTFCTGTIKANKLSGVRLSYGNPTPLEVDFNFTISKAFKERLAEFVRGVKDLKLIDKSSVHKLWCGSLPVPPPHFINLKSLVVERCDFLSAAIPSHILSLLCKLEELEVRQCNSVNTIFEVKDIVKGKKKLDSGLVFSRPSSLKKLTFEKLSNLKHVWDSDPQEIIGLQTLQELYVNGCENLERLFPTSVAKSLVNLEKLEVQHCGRLMEIVAKDEAVKGEATREFVMPCMTSVKLCFLPELKCFYPGPHKLECPKLKQAHLSHCDKLKTFTCESQSFPEAQAEYQVIIPLNPQALLAEKVIPQLEFLAISKQMAMLILNGEFDVNLLHRLETVQLQCFHDDSDTFPYGILQKVPNVEKLAVSCSSFNEIFNSEIPKMDCAKEILSHVKCLQLSSLSKLNSIGIEHSWVDPISENLEKLQIDECHSLRNIVPRKVSFSGLINLNVSQCGGLEYLFTLSTSRTLSQLKNMTVGNCESIKEIMCEEAEESSNNSDGEKIIFHKLETLSLQSLLMLESFYSGSVALSLPSLDELTIIKCQKMDRFCGGAITMNLNRWPTIKFKEDQRDGVLLKIDLNSAIRKVSEGTFF